MRTMLDDESAETTYLLIRDARPTEVVEISPCDGWSTHWILRALADNGQPARLTSYDLHAGARRHVRDVPNCVEWTLHVGDVKTLPIPSEIDFLYMDSDHRASFAHWYLEHVVPRVCSGSPVCIDDIYHAAEPADLEGTFGESRVIHDWLSERAIAPFTASARRAPGNLRILQELKESLGMANRIRASTANTTIFFAAP
jgi:predicted O-methyltransferase YrrM